jgi:hypothetical protein
MSDVPSITFVDPDEAAGRFRVVLWAAPGEGKSVGAASAPGPILVISGDRPGAYRFARRHHNDKDIREVRFVDSQTLADAYTYLKGDGQDVRTVIVDPFGPIYDKLAEEFPTAKGETNWQGLNKKIKGFLFSLRALDVHVVIVAHEKLNDGEGKLYPQLGGPALINTILAESDIVAHVERQADREGEPPQYVAQLAPTGSHVCKESTGLLGARRPLDLSEWFEAATPDDSDLPWSEDTVVEEIQVKLDAVEEPAA